MFDFFKLNINVSVEDLLSNPQLEFKGEYSLSTGEVFDSYLESDLKGLKVKLFKTGYVELQGSFHKYRQAGTNFQDYSYSEFIETIIELSDILKINPFVSVLHNLEFGVNIEPPIETNKILHSIVNYKGHSFSKMNGRTRKSIGIELYTQRYAIKAYNKAMQYQSLCTAEIFRLEIKVFKMEFFKTFGIQYLSDLLTPSKVVSLGEYLRSVYSELVLIDNSIKNTGLSKKEREVLDFWSNPKKLEELERSNRNKFNTQRRYFWSIQKKYSSSKIQEVVARLILDKWTNLIDLNYKSYTKLTDFLSRFPELDLYQFNTSNSMLFPYLFEQTQRCKITGENIGDQKNGSRFVSAKKIGEKEAHRLRNIDSNPRNNLRRKLSKMLESVYLFPIDQVVQLNEEQTKVLSYWEGTKFNIKLR